MSAPTLGKNYSYDCLGKSIAQQLNINLDKKQWQKLEQYVELLIKWNKVYNLTAIKDVEQIWIKHIFDCLAITTYLHQKPLLDIGAGAGLPGLVIAIVKPNIEVSLLESKNKKISFLHQAKTELSLDNVTIIHSRVEEYYPPKLYSQTIARAFNSINSIIKLSNHLMANDGILWAMKMLISESEIKDIPNNYIIKKSINIFVPFLTEKIPNTTNTVCAIESAKKQSRWLYKIVKSN